MEVILTVEERLHLLMALPQQGDYQTMLSVKSLKEALDLSDLERNTLEWQDDGKGTVAWNPAKDKGVQASLSERQVKTIVDALKALGDKNQVTQRHLGLFEKFPDSVPEMAKLEARLDALESVVYKVRV
jgi:hypothetical protein